MNISTHNTKKKKVCSFDSIGGVSVGHSHNRTENSTDKYADSNEYRVAVLGHLTRTPVLKLMI